MLRNVVIVLSVPRRLVRYIYPCSSELSDCHWGNRKIDKTPMKFIKYAMAHEICTWICCVLCCCDYIVTSYGISFDIFINLPQSCLAGTGAMIWSPNINWVSPAVMSNIGPHLDNKNTTKTHMWCIHLGMQFVNGNAFIWNKTFFSNLISAFCLLMTNCEHAQSGCIIY